MPAAPEQPQPPKRPELSCGAAPAVRIAWLLCALFWTAFAVLEAINHGRPAPAAVVAFFIIPGLTFLTGLSHAPDMAKGQLPPPAVPYYNAVHRVCVPFALVLLYTVVPGHRPPSSPPSAAGSPTSPGTAPSASACATGRASSGRDPRRGCRPVPWSPRQTSRADGRVGALGHSRGTSGLHRAG